VKIKNGDVFLIVGVEGLKCSEFAGTEQGYGGEGELIF
jgi:hypothetical protein